MLQKENKCQFYLIINKLKRAAKLHAKSSDIVSVNVTYISKWNFIHQYTFSILVIKQYA